MVLAYIVSNNCNYNCVVYYIHITYTATVLLKVKFFQRFISFFVHFVSSLQFQWSSTKDLKRGHGVVNARSQNYHSDCR